MLTISRLAVVWVCGSLGLGASFARAQDQTRDPGQTTIEIAVEENQMAFDVKSFTVAAGSRVTIRFENTDSMIHNLIVASQPGGEEIYMEIAQQVLDLGAQALARQFVPESDLVLAHSKLLQPGEIDVFTFTAPQEVGSYSYVCTIPGHPRTMNGIMQVTADGKPAEALNISGFSELYYRYYEGRWTQMPDFDRLEPVARGRARDDLISLEARQQDDYFGFVFEGQLPVENPGTYLFMLRSDDGSMLYINGELVINHDGLHGDGEVKLAEVDLAAGVHDLRVEYFEHTVAFNLHLDWAGPEDDDVLLPPLSAQGRIPDVRRFVVKVEDEPQVWRVLLPETSPRSIAVGLPGKVSFCFDPDIMGVRYAWQGSFINRGGMVGHGSGRGPDTVEILGSRFGVGAVPFPLRIGNPETEPAVRFLGYRKMNRGVTFLYEIDGHKVNQTIQAVSDGGAGLEHRFEFREKPTRSIHFLANETGLSLASSAGSWQKGLLTVPADQAKSFTVSVVNPAF